jgi:hypothetical protein
MAKWISPTIYCKTNPHDSIIWQTGYIPSDLDVIFYTEISLLWSEVYLRNVGFKIR